MRRLSDILARRHIEDEAPEDVLERPSDELIEPTPDEARNGWTAETLTAFVAECHAREAKFVHQPRRLEGGKGFLKWRR